MVRSIAGFDRVSRGFCGYEHNYFSCFSFFLGARGFDSRFDCLGSGEAWLNRLFCEGFHMMLPVRGRSGTLQAIAREPD